MIKDEYIKVENQKIYYITSFDPVVQQTRKIKLEFDQIPEIRRRLTKLGYVSIDVFEVEVIIKPHFTNKEQDDIYDSP